MIRIGFQKLESGAIQPSKATAGSAGFDVHACLGQPVTLETGCVELIPTGLAISIPVGYEGQVRARSGLALKHTIMVANGPGTIDSDYRGPLGVILVNFGKAPFVVNPGDRVAQLIIAPVPAAEWVELEELSETSRAGGGFGHSGV